MAQCINSADGEVVDLTSLDDEQLGQLALRNTRPADRDERMWRAPCARRIVARGSERSSWR